MCLYASVTGCHNGCTPSMIDIHVFRASSASFLGKRNCNRSSTACCSSVPVCASLSNLERKSPIAGPPKCRKISAELPPSSRQKKSSTFLQGWTYPSQVWDYTGTPRSRANSISINQSAHDVDIMFKLLDYRCLP
eukprot:TRINITY_DN9628_c0_g1_i8.p1 TRINITY_DN9628_c0_g1~~TRINITY_DN9628_c0_g1_i8.p1  ORF type:complete len:135 (-),score=8.90 TRINITY_DN9628_c0_g1_i8:13-417(-)